jgi:hypothetical protein
MTILKLVGFFVASWLLKGVHSACLQGYRDIRDGSLPSEKISLFKAKLIQLIVIDVILWIVVLSLMGSLLLPLFRS